MSPGQTTSLRSLMHRLQHKLAEALNAHWIVSEIFDKGQEKHYAASPLLNRSLSETSREDGGSEVPTIHLQTRDVDNAGLDQPVLVFLLHLEHGTKLLKSVSDGCLPN